MKILFNADAIRYPLTGIGRYAHELGNRLPKAEEIEKVLYFRDGALHSDLSIRPNTGNHSEKARVRLRRWAGSMPLISKAYHKLIAKQQERAACKLKDEGYIYHGPNYYLPEFSGPCVATFHDLSIFLWPECHPEARVRHMSKELPLTIKRAQVLLTDSEFTRQEIASYFNFPLDRIVTAPLAASPDYRPMSAFEVAPVLSTLKLNYGSYSLFVGTLDPRKNIDILIDVYERMPDALRQRIPLIVAGFEGWHSEKTIERLKAGEHAGWARYLGFVDEAALPSLYAGARVFLFPSRYEGFGLPVLEAMAAGVPVICSNAASLPEVTGTDGATLIPADDVDQLYDAIVRALEDDTWCVAARERGINRASHFSWDKTAAATITAYKLAQKIKQQS
ncbi:glycosyltransferase family 4 protein [Solimicrobium silvestre]|uniref:Glycosyl transferases group 1 n=1 Tax=Solimicrobium silvestre TaxID=2099400 RepID=A0A2S9H1W9_9BURK|nr:glycosyltransferase family 1 protein [Solimicrobium silvestre]PRC93950.1 Glycosyl transferases group 1 [Solimicrobium silvestre]